MKSKKEFFTKEDFEGIAEYLFLAGFLKEAKGTNKVVQDCQKIMFPHRYLSK
jgi:hypothetical protein